MNRFYDQNACRQFNMLGEYIDCYARVVKENCSNKLNGKAHKSEHKQEINQNEISEADLNRQGGEVYKLTENLTNSPSISPIEASRNWNFDQHEDVITKIVQKRAVNYYDNVVLASKLKLANEQISQLEERMRKSSDDYFKMEQIMKQIYYNDLRELRRESEEQIMESKNKLDLLLKISNENQQMWNDRKELLNNILKDYMVNINDCLAIKDLYGVFNNPSVVRPDVESS